MVKEIDVSLFLLAVEDFLPVFLSAAGLAALAKLCSGIDRESGIWCTIALLLIPVGGLTKPIYKSFIAVSSGEVDLVVLDELLFWFLAPGFVALSIGIDRARRATDGRGHRPMRMPVLVVALTLVASAFFVSSGSRTWFFLLLTATTVANIWAIYLLAGWARSRGDMTTAWLFVFSIVIAISLAGAAAALEQTIPVQWGEQLASTLGQGIFFWASVRLARTVREVEAQPVSESM